ncbi:MAG TPA: chemotaxis protein CheX [Terriglobales bacterium]|nr:chemotaxis protein CheX [Terriglobales bacterium]
MRMDLIQPFINAADAVLAETLQCPTKIGDVSMDEEAYRRKGTAAIVNIHGDIEGRVILDLDGPTAAKVASYLAGEPVAENEDLVKETIFELANQIIGNAVTTLNDQGFRFKIAPPELLSADLGEKSNEEQEALVMCFETANGSMYMNVAMRYNRRRRQERSAVAG